MKMKANTKVKVVHNVAGRDTVTGRNYIGETGVVVGERKNGVGKILVVVKIGNVKAVFYRSELKIIE